MGGVLTCKVPPPHSHHLRFRLCPVRKLLARTAQQRSFLWPADPLVVKSCMRAASTLLELYYRGEERAREEKISRVCLANKGVLWRDGPPSSPSTVHGLFCFLFFCFFVCVAFYLFIFFRCSIHPLLPSHVRPPPALPPCAELSQGAAMAEYE